MTKKCSNVHISGIRGDSLNHQGLRNRQTLPANFARLDRGLETLHQKLENAEMAGNANALGATAVIQRIGSALASIRRSMFRRWAWVLFLSIGVKSSPAQGPSGLPLKALRDDLPAASEPAPLDTVLTSTSSPPTEPPAGADLDEARWLDIQQRLIELEGKLDRELERVASAPKKAEEKAPPPPAKTVQWTGQLQSDFVWANQDGENLAEFGDIQNGSDFRRARLGAFGVYGPVDYRLEFDFALAGRPTFLDVFAGVNDVPLLGRVRVGHFFEPFTLDRLTSNRFMTFAERTAMDQAFAPLRNLGVMANGNWLDDRMTYGLGIFRSDSDIYGEEIGDRFESSITGRLTGLLWYSDDGRRYVHIGSAYSWRDPNRGEVRFFAQPEVRLGLATVNIPLFVDTGRFAAESYQLLGLESVATHGPWSIQAEYVYAPVDSTDFGGVDFHGWYVQGSFFLTGEHRPYRKSDGTFDRVRPHCDFVGYRGTQAAKPFTFGPGAWELATRVSQVDLDGGAIPGGELLELTMGVNWYLNPFLRATFNYVHALVTPPEAPRSEADFFIARVGFDF
jgi:phosphate-selective porin OprO/OprP